MVEAIEKRVRSSLYNQHQKNDDIHSNHFHIDYNKVRSLRASSERKKKSWFHVKQDKETSKILE